jgi:predicted class III extradiol MEMO1 family dioxygenase
LSLGLYIASTKTIYIVEQQDLCNQKAILSHEFVHYYQHMKHGWGNSMPMMISALREEDAYRIQYEHEREICGKKLPPYETDVLLGLDK